MRSTIVPLAIATFSLLVLIILSDEVEVQDVGAWMAYVYAWTAVFATFKVMSHSPSARDERSAENYGILGREISWRISVLLAGLCMGYYLLSSDTHQLLCWNIAVRGVVSGIQWRIFFAIVSIVDISKMIL